MIRKSEQINMIERYEYYISTRSEKSYEFRWSSRVKKYYTCGINSFEIECLEVIPESVEMFLLNNGNREALKIGGFNELNPDDQIDFRCNCHGFSFANGKYSIDESYVDFILEDEFHLANSDEVKEKNYDIVVFKGENLRNVHSCKYQYDLYIHKEGVRKFSVHTSIDEIKDIEEYRNTIPVYYKRNSRSCPGICMNSVGEKYFKTFGNN